MSRKTWKEKSLIIKCIIFTVLVAALFAGVIFAFYSRLYEEKRANIIKGGRMSAMQAADLIGNYFVTNTDAIKLTAFALDEMISEKRSDADIQEYLASQSIAIKNVVSENTSGIYGYINEKFFSGVNWIAPEGYDATKRPWYIKPLTDPGQITVLEPYNDLQAGHTMIALGKTLCDGVSVVSVDVSLDRVQTITENATVFENADAEMILTETGIVIAHSDRSEVGKNYLDEDNTLGATVFSELMRTDDDSFEISFGGYNYIVYVATMRNGWHCISVMNSTRTLMELNVLFASTLSTAIVLTAVISFIMITSVRRQITAKQLSSQLSTLSDIYISLHEINFVSDTFRTIRCTNDLAAEMTSGSRHNCQELISGIMEKCTDPLSRDMILDFVDFSKLDHRLKERDTMTEEFLSIEKNWRRARFIVSERQPNGRVGRAMYLIEDIDREKRERDTNLEAVKTMNEQISTVANIYFAMQDIDLKNDTLNEIKTRVKRVNDLIGGQTENAQATMYAVMDQMSDDSTRETIHEFINLSTLDERLKNTNTITEEFMSCRGVWSRARFVVSKRAPDGSIEHVLWLVEGIDAEKRRRDKQSK